MKLMTSLHVVVLIFLNLVRDAKASGVLTIRLTGFRNPYGRTYDGTCCDPSPRDRNPTCVDQCDYVMRLIVMGLGRANDHVFLFHRPLKYDSNNIEFENGDSNLLLTVLFDSWPQDGHVKMNAFFYDYDDFDHTTTLVDWFETDLKHTGNQTADNTDVWGHFQEQSVVGNRQSDKTLLTFEWSALHSENVYNPAFHLDNAQNNTKLDANINIRSSNLKKSIIQKQGFPIGVGSPFRKNDEQLFYNEFARRKPVETPGFVRSVEQFNNEGNRTKETGGRNNNSNRRIIGRHWKGRMIPKGTDGSKLNQTLNEDGDDQKYDENFQQHGVDADTSKVERIANEKGIHQDVELKDRELNLKLNKRISAIKRLSQNKGMKKQIRSKNVPFKAHTLQVESDEISKKEGRETIGKNENLTKSNAIIIPELQDSTTSARQSTNSENMNNTDESDSSSERMVGNHLTTVAEARYTSEEPIEAKQINNDANEETNELTASDPSTLEKHEQARESPQSTRTHESNQMFSVDGEMPDLFKSNRSNYQEKMNPSDDETKENDMGNFKRKIPRSEPYINTVGKTALDHNNIESVKQMLGTIAEVTKPDSSVTSTNGEATLANEGETSVEDKDKNYAGLNIMEVTPAFENNILSELSARKYNGQLDKPSSIFAYGEMTTSNLGQDSSVTTSTIAGNRHSLSSAITDGRGPNSGFSTAWGKEHITEEPSIDKLTAKSYQARQAAKAVTVYKESNETKKIGTVPTLDFDPVEHTRKTEESTNKNNATLPSLSSHFRKAIHVVEIINKAGETVPRVVDFTSTTPQNEHFTKTKYVTEIASTLPEQDSIGMNKFMIDVKSLSGEPAFEEQDSEATSTGSPPGLETTSVGSATKREQPKVWFNARKSHQSNGELLQNNIKVLKTFKSETVAPFQWFVTAQRPYVRPVKQHSEHGPHDLHPDTLQPTSLSNPAVDTDDTIIQVDNLETDITTNGFIPSLDDFAMDSSTQVSGVPESITSKARAQYTIKLPQSVQETDIDVQNRVSSDVGYSPVKEKEPNDHAEVNNGRLTTVENNGLLTSSENNGRLTSSENNGLLNTVENNGRLTTVENKDETNTKSYTTVDMPLFFFPFERIENVDKTNDGNPVSSHETLPKLETVSTIKSAMISKTTKSPLSSTTTKSAMTDSAIRSHGYTVIGYKNNAVSHEQSLEASKSSGKDTAFFDILSLLDKFDKSLNSPNSPGIGQDVVKSIDHADDLKDAKLYSSRSPYVREANGLEQISESEQTTEIQEQDQGVFIKEMINPDAVLPDLAISGGVAPDPSKQSSNTVNSYRNEERRAGQGEVTMLNHHREEQTSMVNNVTEQRENVQTEGSRQSQDGGHWKDEEKVNFSKKIDHLEYFQDVSSKKVINGNVREKSKNKELSKNRVDDISIKYEDVTGNNHYENIQSQAEDNHHKNSHQSQTEMIAEKRPPALILESRPGDMKSVKKVNVEDKASEEVNVAKEQNTVNMREIIPSIFLDNNISDVVTTKENLLEKDNKNIISDPAHGGGEGYGDPMVTKVKHVEELYDNNDIDNNVDMASKIMVDDNSNNDNIKYEQVTARNKDIDRNTHERIQHKNDEILTPDTTRVVKNIKATLPITSGTPIERSEYPASQTQTQSHNSKKDVPREEDQYLANEFQTDTMPSAHEAPGLSKLKSVESVHDVVDDAFDTGNPRIDAMPETLNGKASTSLTESELSKSWPGQSKGYQPSLDIESYSLKKETLEALSLSAPKRQTPSYKNSLPISAWIDGEEILENTPKEDIVKKVRVDHSDSLDENITRPLVPGTNAAISNHHITSSAKFEVNAQSFGSSSTSSSKEEARETTGYLNSDTTIEPNEVFASTTPRQEVTEGQYTESSSEMFNPHEFTQSTTSTNWPQETYLSTRPSNVPSSSKLNVKSEKNVEPKEDTITPESIKNVQIVEHLTNNVVNVTMPGSSTNSGYDGSRTRSSGKYPKDTHISDEYKDDPMDNVLDKDLKKHTELSIEFPNNEIEPYLDTKASDMLIPRDLYSTVSYYKTTSVEASKMGKFDEASPTNGILESSNQTTHDPFDLMNLFIANINLLDSIRDKKSRVDDDSDANVTAVYQSDEEVILKKGDENSLSSLDGKSIKNNTSGEDIHTEITRDSSDSDVTDSTITYNLANDFSLDQHTSDVPNVSSNTRDDKFIELTTTEVTTGARQEKEDRNSSHKQSTYQTTASYLDTAITQSSAPSLPHEDELDKHESEDIQRVALITTESTITMDSNIYTDSNLPTETSQDETKTAATTHTPEVNGSGPVAITKLLDKSTNEEAGSGGLTQNIKNILTLGSYPQSRTLGLDNPNERDPKSLPSIMNPVLYVPPTKANLDKQPLLDLYLQSYSHPKAMLNIEMKTLPENGFKLHTVTQDSLSERPTHQPLHELPWLKLSRANGGVKRNNVHRKINLDKLRSYIKDIRHGPSVHVPRQGLYTPKLDAANQTLRAPDAAAVLPNAVERYGSPYTSINGVSTVFTRYWPAVLGVSIGTMFLLTALITSILCRQRRLMVQRASWSDSPQYLSEPPDPSEYATSSAASLSSDLTRSSVNLVGRHS